MVVNAAAHEAVAAPCQVGGKEVASPGSCAGPRGTALCRIPKQTTFAAIRPKSGAPWCLGDRAVDLRARSAVRQDHAAVRPSMVLYVVNVTASACGTGPQLARRDEPAMWAMST